MCHNNQAEDKLDNIKCLRAAFMIIWTPLEGAKGEADAINYLIAVHALLETRPATSPTGLQIITVKG